MSSARSRLRLLRPAPLLAAALVVSASHDARAEDQDLNVFQRPGGAPQQAAAAPASPLDSLEFCGVFIDRGTTFITIKNTVDSKATVLALGASSGPITVSDYLVSDDSVLVQSGGHSKRLKMTNAKIVAMAVPPPQPVAPPGVPPGAPAVAGGPVPPGSPGAMSDEQVRERMQRVADEIRRRREMRREIMERAQQQQGQPAPTP